MYLLYIKNQIIIFIYFICFHVVSSDNQGIEPIAIFLWCMCGMVIVVIILFAVYCYKNRLKLVTTTAEIHISNILDSDNKPIECPLTSNSIDFNCLYSFFLIKYL